MILSFFFFFWSKSKKLAALHVTQKEADFCENEGSPNEPKYINRGNPVIIMLRSIEVEIAPTKSNLINYV
jgi:hypothetical protein